MDNLITFNEKPDNQNLTGDTALLFKDSAGKNVALILDKSDTPTLYDCNSGSEIPLTNTTKDDTQLFVDSNGCEIAVTVDKHGNVELFNIDENAELSITTVIPVMESESIAKDNGNSLSAGTVNTKEDDVFFHKTNDETDGNVIAIERKGEDLIFHKGGDNMISTGKTSHEIDDKPYRTDDDPEFDRDWDRPLVNEDSESKETKSTSRKKNKFLIPTIVAGLAILCYFYFKK